jgi:hypothetical protein
MPVSTALRLLRIPGFPKVASIPKIRCSEGRRKSPSTNSTFSSDDWARAQARLAEIVLLPSCGMVLVIRTFFRGRIRRRSLKRTPNNLIASAVGSSLSVRHTKRLCKASEIWSVGSFSRTSARLALGNLREHAAPTLGPTGEGTTSIPSRPPPTRLRPHRARNGNRQRPISQPPGVRQAAADRGPEAERRNRPRIAHFPGAVMHQRFGSRWFPFTASTVDLAVYEFCCTGTKASRRNSFATSSIIRADTVGDCRA